MFRNGNQNEYSCGFAHGLLWISSKVSIPDYFLTLLANRTKAGMTIHPGQQICARLQTIRVPLGFRIFQNYLPIFRTKQTMRNNPLAAFPCLKFNDLSSVFNPSIRKRQNRWNWFFRTGFQCVICHLFPCCPCFFKKDVWDQSLESRTAVSTWGVCEKKSKG